MTRVFHTKPVDYTETPADLGLSYNSVRFPTQRGLFLHGWWIPATDGDKKPLLVLLHGWKRNSARMMPYIEALNGDYNLFVFDSRNHGKSDTDDFSSMPRFTEDIIAALDYLEQEFAGQYSGKINLLGLSMGGGASIYAASGDPRIGRVITVGAFANPAEVMRLEYRKRHIPYFPLVFMVFEYFQYHMGRRFSDFAPENNIGNAEARFLLIHGKQDQTAPVHHAMRLQQAARPGMAELFLIEGAGHSDCHAFDGFWSSISQFLNDPAG